MKSLVDTRDLRDPQKLGEALLAVRANFYMNGFPPGGPTLSTSYDSYKNLNDVPNYPQDESMAVLTAREYRAELETRIAAGDKYAESVLNKINKGIGYDDDPYGE